MPGILLKSFGSEHLLSRFDALAIVLQRLLSRFSLFFGEQNISVSTKRRNGERFVRKSHAVARVRPIPCFVHELLRSLRLIVGAAPADCRHKTFHGASVGKRHNCGSVFRGVGFFPPSLFRYWHLSSPWSATLFCRSSSKCFTRQSPNAPVHSSMGRLNFGKTWRKSRWHKRFRECRLHAAANSRIYVSQCGN